MDSFYINGSMVTEDDVTKEQLLAILKDTKSYREGFNAGMDAAKSLLSALPGNGGSA